MDVSNQLQRFGRNQAAYDGPDRSEDLPVGDITMDAESKPLETMSSRFMQVVSSAGRVVATVLRPILSAGRFVKGVYDSIPFPWYVKHSLLAGATGYAIYRFGLGRLLLKVIVAIYNYINPMSYVDSSVLPEGVSLEAFVVAKSVD